MNLPGCRMEFMISTYANCPPYLHIHSICQRKERNACSAQANLKTMAFLCSSSVLILMSATSSLAAIPKKRLCQLKIRREAKQRSLDARGSRKDHVHDGHNGSRSVSCVHQLCSCACTETPQLFSNRHVGTQHPPQCCAGLLITLLSALSLGHHPPPRHRESTPEDIHKAVPTREHPP